MAESPVFAPATPQSVHKLYSILEAAGELPSVMESFIRRLEREETEQVSLLAADGFAWEDRANGEEGFLAAFGLSNLIRLQIIDFLIKNAAKPGYNLAHYLLGFNSNMTTTAVVSIIPPSQEGAQFSCLNLVLELLSYGLGHPSSPIVALDHPSFGLRCYELLNILMSNPRTSRATSNYLRDHEDFYRKHLVFFARDPVDLTDVGYTVLELQQKAALLRGASLDLHSAMTDGAWSYAKKLATVLVHGILGDNDSQVPPLDAGKSLISEMTLSAEAILCQDYLGQAPTTAQEHLLFAAELLIRSASKISKLLLVALDRVPYDRKAIMSLQAHLVTSIVPAICRLQTNQVSHGTILESCASMSIMIVGGYFRKATLSEDGTLSGDEVSSLAVCAIQSILRPDTSVSCRGLLYSVVSESIDLLSTDEAGSKSVLAVLTKESSRLVDIAANDSVVPAIEADAWKTMAATFLRDLIINISTTSPIERLHRIGYIKNLVGSLRFDDPIMLSILDPSCQNLNSLFLWKSKFALLQKISTEANGAGRLLEAGLVDSIQNMRLLDWDRTWPNQSHNAPPNLAPALHRWHLIMLPLCKLLLLLAFDPSKSISDRVASLVTSRAHVFEEIVRNRSPNEDSLELQAIVVELLAITFSPATVQERFLIFHNVLQRAALAQDESLWNKYSISIVNTCLRFIATCLTRESGSFAQDSRFISILTSIMDVLLTVFAKVSVTDSQAILQAYEAILIILITALESPYYDSRQVISIVSPTIEQLQNTISKVPISSVLGLTFRSFRTSTIRLTNC